MVIQQQILKSCKAFFALADACRYTPSLCVKFIFISEKQLRWQCSPQIHREKDSPHILTKYPSFYCISFLAFARSCFAIKATSSS